MTRSSNWIRSSVFHNSWFKIWTSNSIYIELHKLRSDRIRSEVLYGSTGFTSFSACQINDKLPELTSHNVPLFDCIKDSNYPNWRHRKLGASEAIWFASRPLQLTIHAHFQFFFFGGQRHCRMVVQSLGHQLHGKWIFGAGRFLDFGPFILEPDFDLRLIQSQFSAQLLATTFGQITIFGEFTLQWAKRNRKQ